MPPELVSRRSALTAALGLGAAALGAAGCGTQATSGAATPAAGSGAAAAGRTFGAEWEHHVRTIMSWPASTGIWGEDLPAVQADIARLAQTVAGFESVVLLAAPADQGKAQAAVGPEVEVVPIPTDDLWARDTAPVFVQDAGTLTGVDFNFNGWGGKQRHPNDSRVATTVLARYRLPRIAASLVAEGGALETDGQGTLLVTESSLVNSNRNPGKDRRQVEAELKQVLGIRKVIWLAGVKGQDITDAHVDCLVRYVAPGVVLLDTAFPGSPPDVWSRAAEQARGVLTEATDAAGRRLQVVDLPQPDPDRITGRGDAFVSSYANFYIANGAVFLPKFGDSEADDRARAILGRQFPDREVVLVPIDAIAAGGGGIHCSTHDMPG
ncbi:agmatine deiminase family protein [Amycolatopsis sp. WQ 127309]|uniref:agmatine deiminase family protein n=1 Tax=Amycolatopsis sp. WQ 127309 TaxID=2932773 RepID=UPI001FF6603E|nr:agmatine deiminase family protein [Amycolatopsis sp. WQ 127309]UOZ05652.1 agmatine deiminase family protein [Amycolatopsis sp. WQ 127309]